MQQNILQIAAVIKVSLVGVFSIGLVACSEAQKKNVWVKIADDYKPAYTVQELNSKFEVAFRQPSADSIGQVFTDWNQKIQSNTNEFINQNDTVKAVFQVYKEFYKPLDLLKLGNWEWGNKLNSNSKYVVVQNSIYFAVIAENDFDDYNWRKSGRDSIDNFRPPVHTDKTKVLYLTEEYEKSLNQFLGNESTEVGSPDIMSPSRAAGTSEQRYEMIGPFIPVLHGHWGGYWHLATHPDVEIILFNQALTKARVIFRVGYQGGEATLIKTGSRWTIENSKATWIE
jgi:hypothetical protein